MSKSTSTAATRTARRTACGSSAGSGSDADGTSRRRFLADASAALGILGSCPSAAGGDDDGPPPLHVPPEAQWKERMTPPDDGRKYGWFVDTRRCFGCHACEVSCKAENDVPLGRFIRQTFYGDIGQGPQVVRMFLPMACQHCEDAPCIKACPCGALSKGVGGSVLVDYESCCGHASCVAVCPYGAIYIDPVANQAVKCHNCYHRLENEMQPACANTCPADAIAFGDLNDPHSPVSLALQEAARCGVMTTQLRSEKGTRPRMWFAGEAAVAMEASIPGEGQSYGPEAYDIYQWKASPDGT